MIGDIVTGIFSFIFLIVGKTAIIWAPILIMYFAFEMWHHFVTDRFILGMRWTVFEIEVPRDVEKTPMAMELIFTNAFYHASAKGIWETWIQGAPHFWFSLEIAGIDGGVHFYIRTPSRIRDLVETQIYAQYPQAKVREVEDYSLYVPYEAPNRDWYVWGCEFTLERHFAYPIRTYKDYGLDKPSDKEQQKIDPLTPTIEFLGSLKRGQQVWIQHVIRPSKMTFHTHGKRFAHHGWIEEANNQIDEEMLPYKRYMSYMPGNDEIVRPTIQMPKPVETRVVKMQDKIQKLGFDVGIRLVALSDSKHITQDEFDGLRRSVRLLFRQYNNPDGNSIVRVNATQFDSPWADPTNLVIWKVKNRMLNWYRLRTFFHPPLWFSFTYPKFFNMFFIPSNKLKICVLNVEELATLFHFPGQVSQAPSFQRIDSRVAKPPSNLPV